MQKKKIFIEIEVPSQAKKRLVRKMESWKFLPVKWMKEDNLHITLAFLGYVDESVLPEICAKVAEAVSEHESFDIEFEKIALGPDPHNPRMVWLEGKVSEELRFLNESVEKTLGIFSKERKEFRPHVALGRIRALKWDELPEKPEIDEKMHLTFSVDSVLVMESRGGGAEYTPLEECPLS